jgi:hypothetical protein
MTPFERMMLDVALDHRARGLAAWLRALDWRSVGD